MPTRPVGLRALHRETDLQRVIDAWPAAPASCRVVGAPTWLRALPRANEKLRIATALGYRFEPDAVFETNDAVWIAELKLSPQGKYEPLALADVLHHAWMMRPHTEKPIVPMIVAPSSPWLQAAIAQLQDLGLPKHPRHLPPTSRTRAADLHRRFGEPESDTR
jgi:hypothetical protein